MSLHASSGFFTFSIASLSEPLIFAASVFLRVHGGCAWEWDSQSLTTATTTCRVRCVCGFEVIELRRPLSWHAEHPQRVTYDWQPTSCVL